MSDNITERIVQIIDFYKLNNSSFEQKISASNGLISKAIARKSSIKSDILSKILEVCPDIDAYWLITGHGSMLYTQNKPSNPPSAEAIPQPAPALDHDDQSASLRAEIDKLNSICQEKERTIIELKDRIASQVRFLDMLSTSHRDLVERSEKMLEENNHLLHQGNNTINTISHQLGFHVTPPDPSSPLDPAGPATPSPFRPAALAADEPL